MRNLGREILITTLRRRSAARIACGVSGQALAAALAIGAFAAPAYAQDTPPAEPAAQTDDQQAIVVTGFRASLESAVAEKKNRDQVVESVSAEDIGKLPDASIAESIARLPGLTSQRLSGRSNQISIRGFAPDFSTTLLNGREQTSTGDNRAVDYDQYPSEIMSQVIVYKTGMPSIVGQGLSGTVDLHTVRPLEYGKQAISIGVRGSWADLGALNAGSKQYGYRVNGTYIDQFANDTVGVAISAGYLDEPYQIQEFNSWGYADGPNGTKVIGGSKSYVTSTDLKRLGVMGTLEFKPTSNFTMTIDGFYSNFKDDQIKRGIELPLAWGNATLQPGFTTTSGVITHGTFTGVEGVVRNDSFQRHAKLYSFGWNGKYTTDSGWSLMGDASYSRTKRNELILESYAGTAFGQNTGARDTIDFTTSETGTFFTHQLNYSDPNLIVLTDPQGWGGGVLPQVGYYNNRIVDDEIHQFRGEVAKQMDGAISSLKVGANYTDHTKSLVPDESIVRLANGATSMALPAQFRLEPTQQAYLGLGPILSYDPTALLAAGNIYTLVHNTSPDIPAKAYNINEHLFTAYFQGDLKADLGATQLTGNFGVQAVHTDQTSSGLVYVNSSGTYNFRVTGASYWDVMPSVNLSLRFPNDFVIRASAARQVQRPRMDDMRQALSYGVSTQSLLVDGSGGNPTLRPIRSNSFDLSFEKYFGNKGYLAAQFFYKDLKSFIYSDVVPFDYTGYPIDPNGAHPTTLIGTVNHPFNAKGGTIKGVELAGTLPFGEFIHALDGFGVTGGVGYTDTKVIPGPGQPAQDIPGYSKWVINGTAYFEKWGFNARASARYRSTFVGELSGFGGNRVRRRATDETIIDAQVGYDFRGTFLNGLSIFVQGQNLTNEPFVTTNPGQPLQVIDYQVYGRRFLAGASFKF
jgi:iron complex outermembrane receptor protein